MQRILVILGPPGSGKGTQSKLLTEKFGYAFFSMGDTLRKYAQKDNDLGRKIKSMINQGLIVTDDLAEQVVTETWEEMMDKDVLISEGYPRTNGQVDVLKKIMDKHNLKNLSVLSIQLNKDKLIERIKLRSKLEGRADDADMASIEKRFDEYNAKTAKIIEHFQKQGKIIEINGDQSIEGVHNEILTKLA